MKSIFIALAALGLCACGDDDAGGDLNVNYNENSGDVSCEDACRFITTGCVDEESKSYACNNSAQLYEACLRTCSSKNSSVLFDLVLDRGCERAFAFLGIVCE